MARRNAPAPQRRMAKRLGAEEIAGARVALGWTYPPFEIPADLLAEWRLAGARGKAQRASVGSARHRRAGHARRSSRRRCRAIFQRASPPAIAASESKVQRGEAGSRHAQGVGDDARSRQRGAAEHDRRLGRSDRFGCSPRRRTIRSSRRAITPGASSITACASTAWPRR